jgi:cell division septation protein DedD
MTRAASLGLPAAAKSLEQMDKFVPAPDRQRGIALAEQMRTNPAIAGAPTGVAPRIEGTATRPAVRVPAPDPAKATPAVAASSPKPVPAVPAATAGGRWRAQLGAYGSPAAAQAQWSALSRRIAGLGGLQPSYEKAGAFTRLRVGPLASRGAADKLCASAKAAGQACFPVAP